MLHKNATKVVAGIVALLVVAIAGGSAAYRLSYEPLANDVTADRILLEKAERRLTLFRSD